MKVKIVTIAIGLSLAISAARGTPILNIMEINEHLVATFNGAPPSFVTITQTDPDSWTIGLSQGWTLNIPRGLVIQEIGEPEGGVSPHGFNLENSIAFGFGEFPTLIRWESESETIGSPGPPSAVVPGMLISPSGERFDIRVADVPELSSAISIFGIGLAGLAWFAWFARFRRTAM